VFNHRCTSYVKLILLETKDEEKRRRGKGKNKVYQSLIQLLCNKVTQSIIIQSKVYYFNKVENDLISAMQNERINF